MKNSVFNVQEYGAIGDGCALDTAAIQRAIDTCSENGGGIVYFHPGVYHTGTLRLKSNIRLYLETGSKILGSASIEDYEEVPRLHPEEYQMPFWFLFHADGAENITIEGRGTIDGNGREFWTDQKINKFVVGPKEKRPRALMGLFNCRNLAFNDFTIHNSPCWTVWLVGCDNATIDGLTIENPYDGPNTDAIDIDCSQNVRIANCHIKAGDDCIALKSDTNTFAEKRPCENVVVENCTFYSSACAIRVGYEGDAPIRNCLFNNITIAETDIGIDIVSIIPLNSWSIIEEGAGIENIVFSNITMTNVNQPIFVWMGNETKHEMQGFIKNISFRNIHAEAQSGCFIGGMPEQKVGPIVWDQVRLVMSGPVEPFDGECPGVWGGGGNQYGIWFRHADDISLHNVFIDWQGASGERTHQIFCEESRNVQIAGFRSWGFPSVSQTASVGLNEVNGAWIHENLAEEGTACFLTVSGKSSRAITVSGNDFHRAKEVCSSKTELSAVWSEDNRQPNIVS